MSVLQNYSKSSIIEESKARQVCSMEDQITFTDVEYGNRKRTTKREEFLNKMDEIVPWEAWVRSWMLPSYLPPVPRKTIQEPEIRRCIRRRKEISGIMGGCHKG